MQPLVEGMQGMIEYVAPLVNERIEQPGDDFISVLAQGEKGRVYAAPSAGEFVAPVVGRARDDHQPLVQRHPGLHAPP